MKVLFLSAANSIHTVRWVNSLTEKGYEVVLISLINHKNTEKTIDKKIKIIYLPFSGTKGYYLNKFFMNLILKKESPDIINVHYASGYGTLGRFISFRPKLLNVWGSDIYLFPQQSSMKRKILQKNLASYQEVASTSYCMAEEIKKFLPKEKKIHITPFGVDVSLFQRLVRKEKSKQIVIGITKSLKEVYGIKYLIQAIKILESTLDTETFSKIELRIYGDGEVKMELMDLIEKLNLSQKIKLLGYLPHIELPKILNELDIVVMPSLSESFGVAAVEAMACGIPVIVSDAEGLKEVVIDGETGFVVPKKDSKAIAEKIQFLIENEELRVTLGKQGRERVMENYD